MSPSNIHLDYTTIRNRRRSRRYETIMKKRLLEDEVYASDESCVICLDKECHPEMKMCPSCENIFHSHCIAGWLVEFMNHSCPHCRIRLTHRMLEDVEVVLLLKVLHTSSTQTMCQTPPATWTGEHDYSSRRYRRAFTGEPDLVSGFPLPSSHPLHYRESCGHREHYSYIHSEHSFGELVLARRNLRVTSTSDSGKHCRLLCSSGLLCQSSCLNC